MSSTEAEEKVPEDAEEEPDIQVEQEPEDEETSKAPVDAEGYIEEEEAPKTAVDAEGYIESVPPELPSGFADDVVQDDVPTGSGGTHESTSEVPKKWIYLLGCVCLFFIVVLVLQIVVLQKLVDDDESADDKTDTPSAAPPTTTASPLPTLLPTLSFSFTSISNNANAYTLFGVSNCDDCYEYVRLPFAISWFGGRPVNELVVYADGFITPFGRDVYTGASDPIPIGKASYPRIAVAQEDLNSELGGKVFVLIDSEDGEGEETAANRVIISWEGVKFHISGGYLNAQAILHSNGIVDLCWGDADTRGNNIAAGAEDGRAIALPATGSPFDDNSGMTSNGDWPTGQCRRFDIDGDYETIAPTSSPTEEYLQDIYELIKKSSPDSGAALSNQDSPQYAAWKWITENDYFFYGVFSEEKILESYALATLYYSTSGENWWMTSGWLDDDPCIWNGVECYYDWWTDYSHTAGLYLSYNNLAGTIPREISMLSNLNSLYLSSNELTGPIPSEVSRLSSLEFVVLSSNSLSGTIPTNIFEGENITEVYLQQNFLTGTIPPIPKPYSPESRGLQTLHLGYNSLSGTIAVSSAANLYFLDYMYNFLKGTIPTELSVMTNLEYLKIGVNELSGTIPTQLSNLENLYYLDLSFNNLIGTMPDEVCELASGYKDDSNYDRFLSIAADCDEISCACCQTCCYGDRNERYCTWVTFSPTRMPTGTPSISPAPTITPSPTRSPASFMFLKNTPGAQRLENQDSCSYCYTTVELPFTFYWFGKTPVANVTVSTDGYIEVYSYNTQGFTQGFINIAYTDLNTYYGGSLWTYASGDTFIISWEDVNFGSNSEAFINAQAILWPNGDIDICYGEAKTLGLSIISSLSNYDNRYNYEVIPAEGPQFDNKGYTIDGLWPHNTCQRFSFGLVLSPEPSATPTITPSPTISAAPTFLGFVSIAKDPDAKLVMSHGDDNVEIVKLPFVFNWLGDEAVEQLFVSINGQINIFKATDNGCCAPHPLSIDNDYSKARIAVAQADLKIDYYFDKYTDQPSSYFFLHAPSQTPHSRNLEEYYGDDDDVEVEWVENELEEQKQEYYYDDRYGDDEVEWEEQDRVGVWTLHTGRSFIISWENVVFAGTPYPVNAQVTLYGDGSIDICWGKGVTRDLFDIAAGLLDTSKSPPVALPATGFPFGDDGITIDGAWPRDQCRQFKF